MRLDLFGCCLRKQGKRVVLFSQIRKRDILKLFSALLVFVSLRNIPEDFDLTSLQTYFYPYHPVRLQTIYFVFSDPAITFFNISHSPLQKNNDPSFTIFLSCPKSINSLRGSFTIIFFCSRKIALFILFKFLSTLCY